MDETSWRPRLGISTLCQLASVIVLSVPPLIWKTPITSLIVKIALSCGVVLPALAALIFVLRFCTVQHANINTFFNKFTEASVSVYYIMDIVGITIIVMVTGGVTSPYVALYGMMLVGASELEILKERLTGVQSWGFAWCAIFTVPLFGVIAGIPYLYTIHTSYYNPLWAACTNGCGLSLAILLHYARRSDKLKVWAQGQAAG